MRWGWPRCWKVFASGDTEVLEKRSGIIASSELKTLSPRQLRRYFHAWYGAAYEGLVRVKVC